MAAWGSAGELGPWEAAGLGDLGATLEQVVSDGLEPRVESACP